LLIYPTRSSQYQNTPAVDFGLTSCRGANRLLALQ
jgi:hypothetical protein